MTHADFAPITLFVVVVGLRWLAGMAHGAAMIGDKATALTLAILTILIQGSGCVAAEQLHQAVMSDWFFVLLSGASYVTTAAPLLSKRGDVRLFSIIIGHLALYAIVAGLLATITTAVVLGCTLAPSVLVTLTGFNKGAGYYYLGETGAPVPRVVESLVWSAALSVLGLIAFVVYRLMI